MLMHRLLHSPISLVVIIFFAVALIVVIVDVIGYFGYYFHNHWTEATWIDDVTGADQHEKAKDDGERKQSGAHERK